MKLLNILLILLFTVVITSCSTSERDPAQADCNPKDITNAGTHFDDYERCNDL